jgi:RHS repeat-associated protein
MKLLLKTVIALLVLAGVCPSTAWAGASVTYEYDSYGNCKTITKLAADDAVLEKTSYEYDDYRRAIAYTEAKDTAQERTWNWVYDRINPNGSEYAAAAHTSKKWRLQHGPAFNNEGHRRTTERLYDYNDRMLSEKTGAIMTGATTYSDGPDVETRHFTYDNNGNKETFRDPLGRVTDYEHDLRDRLVKTIEPLNRVTETGYDARSNKILVTFPDQTLQRWELFDPFGQAWLFIDESNNATDLTYQWGPMKKLHTVITHRNKDDESIEDQLTTFEPDGIGRPHRTIFPDETSELTTYEHSQVSSFKTRKGQMKQISYDARGREVSHVWENESAPGVSRSWDDASRLLTLCNIYSTIDYHYDGAGLTLWEGNTIAGSGGRRQTTYQRNDDGSVSEIEYPDGLLIHRDYTARAQLKGIEQSPDRASWQPVIDYTYLADGKVQQADYANGMQSAFEYDGRGMTRLVNHQKISPQQSYSSHEYGRDDRDRITSLQKGDGLGDRFRYDEKGQLREVWYNAANPASSGAGSTRYESFDYDKMGNRRGTNLGRWGATWFARRDNGLNQYLSWRSGMPVNHEANGEIVHDGWITASYNAQNQPISMTSPASDGTMWFGYDPAGRCVKRWLGPSGAETSNPATYLYYDGWNLIEEGSSATSPSRNYVHGGRVDEIVLSSNVATGEQAYHHYDARTHAVLLTNSSGGILEQYEYDAFGQPYVFDSGGQPLASSTFGNRFLFTGREWLKGLDIYDYRNRMYQPELGRFLQPDPMGFTAESSSVGNPKKDTFATPWSASGHNMNARRLDSNLYRYCNNDPINRTDPEGLGFLQALSKVFDATKPIGERLVNALKAAGASNKQAEKTVAAGHNVANKAATSVAQVGEQMPGSAPSVPQGPAGWGALTAEVINGGIDGLNEGSAIDLRTGAMKHNANNYRAGWWKAFFGLPVDGDQ